VTRQPEYLRKLKELSRAELNLGDLHRIEEELFGIEGDRALVISSVAFLEGALDRLHRSRLRQDLSKEELSRIFDFEGTLGSFSSKILMAYALNIIGPISRDNLDLLRHLRNAFAHSRRPLRFDMPEISNACDKLTIVDAPQSFPPVGYLKKRPVGNLGSADFHSKTRFVTACHTLIDRIFMAKDGPREGDFAYPNNEPLP
jgi:hypothetical protein